MCRTPAAFVLALSATRVVLAAEAIQPIRLELVANFNAASVYAWFAGDSNRNAAARLEYRSGNDREFRPGHPLSRTGPGRFAGSIFGLQPDRPLEVRVTFDDPDAAAEGAHRKMVLTAASRTRSETFPAGTGKTCYVGPRGNDANPGTRDKPFKTIQHACDVACAGDSIYLLNGMYFESVTIRRSGRPDAYITLRPDPMRRPIPGPDGRAEHPRASARIIGSVPAAGPWRRVGKGLFSTEEKRPVGTISDSNGRIYHHRSLEALTSAMYPLNRGWWQDAGAGRLYLRSGRDEAPGPSTFRLGVLPWGLRFLDCGYWIVDNLEFELFGGGRYSRGIEINNSPNVVVRNCTFNTMRTGIAVRKAGSRDCLIEYNRFVEHRIWTWPWRACKGHDVEGAAVSLRAGPGNVVRFNSITGFFNGIVPGTWGDLKNESFNRDLDIHDNTFTEIGDDPLEPEGACMNVRFWRNDTRQTLQGISLAPITVGPVYVVRDRYIDYKESAVKVSVGSRGPVFLYHIVGWTNRARTNGMQGFGQWDNMHFRNCILRGTEYVIEDEPRHPIGCSFDYCCFFSTSDRFVKWSRRRYGTVRELPAADGFGRHILRVEPYRLDRGGLTDTLNPALIDAGVHVSGINDDFKGHAPDMGPDEVK